MNEKKVIKGELPGMPPLDELGKAAYAYKQSCLELESASSKKSFCAEALIKALSKSGKKSIRIENVVFFHRRAKECIVERRVSGRTKRDIPA